MKALFAARGRSDALRGQEIRPLMRPAGRPRITLTIIHGVAQ
jgi:hypothetical protein